MLFKLHDVVDCPESLRAVYSATKEPTTEWALLGFYILNNVANHFAKSGNTGLVTLKPPTLVGGMCYFYSPYPKNDFNPERMPPFLPPALPPPWICCCTLVACNVLSLILYRSIPTPLLKSANTSKSI